MPAQRISDQAEVDACASAPCRIAAYWAYWAGQLGRSTVHAYQASRRGGHLYCGMLQNGRIAISGEAALVAEAEIVAEL